MILECEQLHLEVRHVSFCSTQRTCEGGSRLTIRNALLFAALRRSRLWRMVDWGGHLVDLTGCCVVSLGRHSESSDICLTRTAQGRC